MWVIGTHPCIVPNVAVWFVRVGSSIGWAVSDVEVRFVSVKRKG
jgi:hypothetical protein